MHIAINYSCKLSYEHKLMFVILLNNIIYELERIFASWYLTVTAATKRLAIRYLKIQ